MYRNRLLVRLVRLVMVLSLTSLILVEKPGTLGAAGELVNVPFDDELINGFYSGGIQAYNNGDLVTAVKLLFIFQHLHVRVHAPLQGFDQQLDNDIRTADSVLRDGLNAWSQLPIVQHRLESCEAQPQCRGGGGSALNPNLVPQLPRTNLPPVPPRFRPR